MYPTPWNTRNCLSWWRHQMETFSALLAICAGNSPVPGEFPTQRPVTRSFDVYLDLHSDKRLSKQSWGWWFETLSHSLWRHRNDKTRSVPCPRMVCRHKILVYQRPRYLPSFVFCECTTLHQIKLLTAILGEDLLLRKDGCVHCFSGINSAFYLPTNRAGKCSPETTCGP